MSTADLFTIHTDGAARGNPGPAAFAYIIDRAGHAPIEESGCLGETTNNVAEYVALVKALERAGTLGGRRLAIHSDSELIVKQMKGQYRVKHDGLVPLYEQAQLLAETFDSVSYHHIRREQNKRADELCNEALDGAAGISHSGKKTHKSTNAASRSRRPQLAEGVREDILDCLRSVACAWSAGNPNVPRPEDVWEQLWTILEEAGVLKSVRSG
jgi:ribonuclease HI